MRVNITIAATFLFTAIMAGNLRADDKPSAAIGERLFNDPGLGGPGNARSCSTCHPGGRGLENAGNNPDLDSIINRCITGPLGGRKIPVNSVEMQSLILYIQTLKSR